MDQDEVEVHKLAKKERGQYPAILTEQTWSIEDLLYGFRGNFACGMQRVVPSGQDGSILPASAESLVSLSYDIKLPVCHLRLLSLYKNSARQRGLEDTNKRNWMAMLNNFFGLCPLGLTIKLNFNISKVANWRAHENTNCGRNTRVGKDGASTRRQRCLWDVLISLTLAGEAAQKVVQWTSHNYWCWTGRCFAKVSLMFSVPRNSSLRFRRR